MLVPYKNNKQRLHNNSSQRKRSSVIVYDASIKSLDTQVIIHEIQELCEELTCSFYENNIEKAKDRLYCISTKLSSYFNFIQYKCIESSIINIFQSFNFENFILKVCDSVISSDQNKDIIDIIINIFYLLVDIDNTFFQNQNIIPFLNVFYFDHENTLDNQQKIIKTYSQILSNQIVFDPNFETFSPYFFNLLESFDDYSLKSKLIESFINSSNEMKIYFHSLIPYLFFFLDKERCNEIEIDIIAKLIEDDTEIYPELVDNGFIDHILNSTSKCQEEINIQIIYFYLFLLQIDDGIKEHFNFDKICIKFFNSENENEQICALNYFCHFFPDCMQYLYDEVGIDLVWAIISDGLLVDSTIELKLNSIQFLLKLLQFNENGEMWDCILESNLCEMIEIILNLDEIEHIYTCFDVLNILLTIATKDANYAPFFIDQFKSSDVESILADCSDEKVQIMLSDFLIKINELSQNF